MGTLEQEMTAVLNRYSAESESGTPDFILAQFLLNCLSAWNVACKERREWLGKAANETLEQFRPI